MLNQHFLDHGQGLAERGCAPFHAISKPVAASAHYAPHHHDTASLSMLLRGAAIERATNGRVIERIPGMIVCNPAGETHSLAFTDQDAHSIVIEIDTARLNEASNFAAVLDEAQCWEGHQTAIWGLYLHQALIGDLDPNFVIEDAVFSLLRPKDGGSRASDTPPLWLRHARQRLREAPSECTSILQLAAIAGVDAAHFAREFRRHYRMTASVFRLQCKLERACRALLETEATIAEAANLAGFAWSEPVDFLQV
jgi:AraC family transcriptional regulator